MKNIRDARDARPVGKKNRRGKSRITMEQCNLNCTCEIKQRKTDGRTYNGSEKLEGFHMEEEKEAGTFNTLGYRKK